jgi:hypothetical protein
MKDENLQRNIPTYMKKMFQRQSGRGRYSRNLFFTVAVGYNEFKVNSASDIFDLGKYF